MHVVYCVHVFENLFCCLQVQTHCNDLEGQLHEAEESLASARQENGDLQAVAEQAKAQIHVRVLPSLDCRNALK